MYLIENDFLPGRFAYPPAVIKLTELGLTNFGNWAFFDAEAACQRMNGLKERYPQRMLVPFARRFDDDDIACLTAEQPGKVYIIHDFASAGWEVGLVYDDVWQWVIPAIRELAQGE